MFTTRRRFTSFPALSRRGERAQERDAPRVSGLRCALSTIDDAEIRALLDTEVSERLMVAADLAVGHPERAAVLRAEADAITAVMGDV